MAESAHEVVIELEPPVSAADGAIYSPIVVARAAPEGGLAVWIEFASAGTSEIWRTDVETRQAGERDVRRWAATLSDVYLRGALARATCAPGETAAHRAALSEAAQGPVTAVARFDPFAVFDLGEHALRRELLLFSRTMLRALIIHHDLNPTGADLSTFSKDQLVAFIVAVLEARAARRSRAS